MIENLPLDVVLFVITVAGFLAIGLPLITRRVGIPRRIEFACPADSELTTDQTRYFARFDGDLLELGYRPAGNWRPVNMDGRALIRLYLSEVDPAVIMLNLLTSEVPGGDEQGSNYLEIMSRFADGSIVTTRNADVSDVTEPLPEHTIHELRNVKRPSQLKRAHDESVEPLRVRGVLFTRADELESSFHEFHRRWCEHQIERGLLRPDANDSARLRATVKAGVRGIATYLNPLADNFTPLRFVAALALGLGLPAAGILWLSGPGSPLVDGMARASGLDPEWCLIGCLAGVMALSGAVVGAVFTVKSFIWSFLLTYVLLRLAAVTGFWPTLVLCGWSAVVADWTGRWRIRAQRLA